MDFVTIMAAGVATDTLYRFAAVGEIFAERSGVLNLGVTGMMLMGAVGGFATVVATGDPWLGLLVGMAARGLRSLPPALFTINSQAAQVVSGVALTFVGTGLARVLGEGLSKAGATSLLPKLTVPILSDIPIVGAIVLRDPSVLVDDG